MDGIKRIPGGKTSTTQHKTIQKSSTLNRKYVKKPVPSPKITTISAKLSVATKRRQLLSTTSLAPPSKPAPVAHRPSPAPHPASTHPHVATTHARLNIAAAQPRHLTAAELKDRAIRQAMNSLATIDTDAKSLFVEEQITETITKRRHFWQSKKFIAATSMAVASIALLGYLIHINLPDLSVRVAAIQTGIDAAYPAYIPAGYHLDGLVSEKNGKIEMTFKKSDAFFTLTEEKSPWDSSALLTNFVQPKWDDNYITARESGLTLYISDSNAAWVSGGILYIIQSSSATFTKQTLHDIALSL